MPKPAREQPRTATQPVVIVLATVLASLPILAVAQFIAHARVDEFDAWLFAYYGREMLDGRTLYLDLWDNKPPGVFWINALGLGLAGGRIVGMWVLCGLATCTSAALLFAATKRLYGWATAGIATVLGALYLNIWLYHVGCNRPNTFFVPTELACFTLYTAAVTGAARRRSLLYLAGLCGGLSLCFKQTALAVSAAVAIHTLYLAARRRVRRQEASSRLIVFGAGWLTTVAAAVFAILLTSDARLAWHAVVGFNRLYFAAGVGSSLLPRFFAVEEHLRALGLPLILAAATFAQPVLRRFVGGAAERDDDRMDTGPDGLLPLLWLWMICGVYLALVGPHRRLPYFGIALPPLVMLSAHGIHLLLRSGRRITETRPAYHVAVGGAWFAYMMVFPLHRQVIEAGKQHYHRFDEPPDRHYVATIEAVRRWTEPDDTLFVFGYAPKLYWEADRPSAVRYIGTEKAGQLRQHGQPVFDEIIDLLMADPPGAIVVHPHRFRRSPDGRSLDTSEVFAWLDTHYQRPDEDGAPEVWLLRD